MRATSLLLPVPRRAFNLLGEWKKADEASLP